MTASHSYTKSRSMSRPNKTLGWFLNDSLLEGRDENNSTDVVAMTDSERKKSPKVVYKSDLPSKRTNIVDQGEKDKKPERTSMKSVVKVQKLTDLARKNGERYRKQQQQHHHKERAYDKMIPSMSSNYHHAPENGKLKGAKTIPCTTAVIGDSSKLQNDMKDAYWYYDENSDGFYYDFNGSRGWRRRNPNKMQQIPKEAFASMYREQMNGHFPGAAAMMDQGGFFSPIPVQMHRQQYYDPQTDGFYFEMPSVDGWKKRSPSHAVATAGNRSSATPPANNIFGSSNILRPQNGESATPYGTPYTSYGAALAEGRLPPCSVAVGNTFFDNSMANMDMSTVRNLFSSDSSSSNHSSACDPCSPLLSCSMPSNQHVAANSSLGDETASLNEPVDGKFCEDISSLFSNSAEKSNKVATALDDPVWKIDKQMSYAEVVSAVGDADDTENSPPENESINKRPMTLAVLSFNVGSEEVSQRELTNFNADKFIAGLTFDNSERVAYDLSALKTPCSTGIPMCSMDSPHTPMLHGIPAAYSVNANAQNDSFNTWWQVEEMLSDIISDMTVSPINPVDQANEKTSSSLGIWPHKLWSLEC